MVDTVYHDSPTMNSSVLSMQESIQQNHDIRGGKKYIFLNKEVYFNKLDEQEEDQFKAMVEMAPVYILYPKVVDGFVGTVFAKSPNMTGIELNDDTVEQNKNIDLLGNSLDKYSENVLGHVMEDGYCATLNEYSNELKRPFLKLVKPDQFMSFRSNSDLGYPRFDQFIFKEEIESQKDDDEFDSEIINQYTVLDLANNPNNKNKLNYRQRIFKAVNPKENLESKDKREKMVLLTEKFPKKNSEYFDDIPVRIHGVDSSNFTVSKSLLQDISDMNISVMQRVVDQVYMLHWTALPTPYVIGADDNDAPITIGPSKFVTVTNTEAKIGMLEFTGNSARAHQDYIENLLYIMSVMGAQILKKEGVSRETATSVLVRTSAQTSLVATMVDNSSAQIKGALVIHFEWSGETVKKEFEYKLNKDFIKVDMEPNAQIALVKSWLDGALSHESLFNKFKEGELVHPNRTFNDELEAIKKNPPPFFAKQLEQKNALAIAEANAQFKPDTGSGGDNKNDINGSNLDNGNTGNPMATEQV